MKMYRIIVKRTKGKLDTFVSYHKTKPTTEERRILKKYGYQVVSSTLIELHGY